MDGRFKLKCRLKEVLKEKKKTQGWLAQRLGLHRNYINGLCTGRLDNPTLKVASAICFILGCTYEEVWSLVIID